MHAPPPKPPRPNVVLLVFAVLTAALLWHERWSSQTEPDESGPAVTSCGTACTLDMEVEATEVVPPTEAVRRLRLPPRGAGADAKVNIVECGDYQCPFCRRAHPTMERLRTEYSEVAFYWLHAPLPMHEHAMPAARAAVAASRQGKFWPMHDELIAHRGAFDQNTLVGMARNAGLDLNEFLRDLDDPQLDQMIKQQRRVCVDNGVRGVPTFFINDEPVVGAQPYEVFKRKVEDALEDAA